MLTDYSKVIQLMFFVDVRRERLHMSIDISAFKLGKPGVSIASRSFVQHQSWALHVVPIEEQYESPPGVHLLKGAKCEKVVLRSCVGSVSD